MEQESFLCFRGTCRNHFGISWNMQESFWDIVKHAGIILGSHGIGIILGFRRAYRNHFRLSLNIQESIFASAEHAGIILGLRGTVNIKTIFSHDDE